MNSYRSIWLRKGYRTEVNCGHCGRQDLPEIFKCSPLVRKRERVEYRCPTCFRSNRLTRKKFRVVDENA